jgi:hypothetical protein
MNTGECIVLGLCVVVAGLVALTYIAGKYNMLEDKKNKK